LITVKPAPVVTVTGDPIIKVCYPAAPFDLTTIRPYQPADAIWSSTNNIVTANGLVRPDNIPADGNYVLTLTKTIGNCTDTKTITLLSNKIPTATFTSSSLAICQGQSILLDFANPLNYKTTWLRDNAVIALDKDSIRLTVAGTYKLIVDNNSCTAESSSSYEVRSNPTFDLNPDLESCKNGIALQFFPINPSPGLGKWTGPGVNETGGWNPASPDVPASGKVTLTYLRTSEDNCSTTKSFDIQIHPVPDIKVNVSTPNNNDTIEIYGPAKLTASGGVLFEWSPASTLSASTGPEVDAKPAESTDYTVKVTTDKGCKGEEKVRVNVDQQFTIYDGVSPNGDGKNDVWRIKNIQRYPNAKVKIFNRWGNLVFESDAGYTKPWDGRFEGNPVPPGAYYYIVDLGQGLTPKSGSITVLR
jgi:gliding motility-associated-like protein